jgi:hypothetical protein
VSTVTACPESMTRSPETRILTVPPREDNWEATNAEPVTRILGYANCGIEAATDEVRSWEIGPRRDDDSARLQSGHRLDVWNDGRDVAGRGNLDEEVRRAAEPASIGWRLSVRPARPLVRPTRQGRHMYAVA